MKKFLHKLKNIIMVMLGAVPYEYVEKGYIKLGQGRDEFDKVGGENG